MNMNMSKSTEHIQITQTTPGQIPAMADIFMVSFADSVRYVFGDRTPTLAPVRDVFSFIVAEEPQACLAAYYRTPDQVRGYILAPLNMQQLWWKAFSRGYLLRWGIRLVKGSYNLGPRSILRIIQDKLCFAWETSRSVYRNCAQILSLAVAPDARGQGVGTALLESALRILKQRGARQVKLEVRPDNLAAHHLYSKFGFRSVDTMSDARGRWSIMLKEITG